MDLNETAAKALAISQKRAENGAFTNDEILKHTAGEVIEAVEAREYYRLNDSNYNAYAEVLADVIICILIAAAMDGIDIENAVLEKMAKNQKRAERNGDKA